MKPRFQNFVKIVFVFFCLLLAHITQAQINQLLNTFGQYQVRADACGTNGISCPITIEKPANATTVHKAYIYYANNPNTSDQGTNAVSVSGGGLSGGIVPMTNLTSSASAIPNFIGIVRYEDVTALFAPGLDTATAGTNIVYAPAEIMTDSIEGVGIIVVWNNPTVLNTAIHVSIGSSLSSFVVTDSIITSAINTSLPFFSATLGLGISFSTGYALLPFYPAQISTASINGVVLDNNVGSYEDGILADGGLITLGGFGDSKTSLDDEYYDFASFIPNGSTLIKYEITGSIDDWVNVVYFEVVGVDPGERTHISDSICNGDSILLAGAYQTTGGIYYDSLKTTLGFDSIIITTLTINPLPNISTSPDILICLGDTIDISATGGVTYLWDNGLGVGQNHTITPDITTTYTVTGTDANGCADTSSVVITVSSINAIINPSVTNGSTPLTVFFGNGSSTGSGVIYNWNFSDGTESTLFEPTNEFVEEGEYIVKLVVTSGFCYDSTTVLIEVMNESSIFIPNVFTPNGDGTNDFFSVNGINLESEEGEIYNRWGRKIFSWSIVGTFWDGINASDGTYYYIIKATGIDGNEYNEKGSFTLIR